MEIINCIFSGVNFCLNRTSIKFAFGSTIGKTFVQAITVSFIATSCFLATSVEVFAISDQALHVEPAFQEVVITASESAHPFTYKLTNNTGAALALHLRAVDIQQIDEHGAIQFFDRPKAGNAFSLASYIQLPAADIILAPGEHQDVTLSVINSNDLSPGGHYASIISEAKSVTQVSNTQVNPALSAIVLLRKIGGENYHINLLNVSPQLNWVKFSLPTKFSLEFENDGNIHTTPHGRMRLMDLFGREVSKGYVNISSFIILPESRRQIEVKLLSENISWPIMLYSLKVDGSISPGDVMFSASQSFLYVSWQFLLILTLVLLVLWRLLHAHRRRNSITR
jgi:hypothetical protein